MIEAQGLTKAYGSVLALQDATFQVRQGEVLGMLGPNGAGKTTTMKLLTTFLRPTAGTATVAGHDIREDPLAVRASVGYLPEHSPLYGDMEVREYLGFMGRARGLAGGRLRERIDWVLDRCALRDKWRTPIPTLSFGYRQRVCLAQALLHDPPVLILDEPTTGLDPLQIMGIRDLIRDLARTKAVVFSTHILQEAAATSDRLLVIHQGRVVADGTLEELQKRAAGGYRTAFAVEGADPGVVRTSLEAVPGVLSVEAADSGKAHFHITSSRSLAEDLYDLGREKGWNIRRLSEDPPSLEQTFIELTRRSRAEEASEEEPEAEPKAPPEEPARAEGEVEA